MGKLIDMTGWKMWEHGVPDSKLTIIGLNEEKTNLKHMAMWECKCSCGSEKIVIATRNDLVNGKVRSCGCLKAENNRKKWTTHGETKTRLYSIWRGIKNRCYNKSDPAYDRYGGRGISVCDEWRSSYKEFREWSLSHGYNDNLTIDRIDVNGNYEPSNCRWADAFVQANNRTNNHLVEFEGKEMTLSELANMLKMPYNTISNRINHLGYSVEDCSKIPIGDSKKGLHIIEYDGASMSMSDWARKIGVSLSTLSNRINKRKWSIEKALTTPVDLSKKRR